jgi:hypothetical protein
MPLSSFFSPLRSAYQSELDDLSLDSEGGQVLQQRLAQKRKQLGFLLQMMTLSPEMVAVVFHKGFEFSLPAVMEHVLSLESDEFPDWVSLADAVRLQPWAQPLAAQVLKEPMGQWFMTVAACLEFMHQKPDPSRLDYASEDYDDDHDDEDHVIPLDADDAVDLSDRRTREETAADWMEAQGFDRKD